MWDAIAHLPTPEDEDRAAVIDEARRIEAKLRIRLAAQERLDLAAPALLAVAKKCLQWIGEGPNPKNPIKAIIDDLEAAIAIAEDEVARRPSWREVDPVSRLAELPGAGKLFTCPKCGEVSYVKAP
jgi:hypothetical protein